MFGISDFGLFIIAGLLLNITPGVDMLYVMHRAGSHGFKAGFVASLGIAGGCMVHIFLAVIGLSALIAASATAFSVIKLLGAAYLIYLGIKMMIQKSPSKNQFKLVDAPRLFDIFKQGVLINLLNPKMPLFFMAFIPQFIDVGSTQKPMAFLILGLIFNLNSTLVVTIVAWLTTKAKDKMKPSEMLSQTLKKLLGVGFISLGAKLALDR